MPDEVCTILPWLIHIFIPVFMFVFAGCASKVRIWNPPNIKFNLKKLNDAQIERLSKLVEDFYDKNPFQWQSYLRSEASVCILQPPSNEITAPYEEYANVFQPPLLLPSIKFEDQEKDMKGFHYRLIDCLFTAPEYIFIFFSQHQDISHHIGAFMTNSQAEEAVGLERIIVGEKGATTNDSVFYVTCLLSEEAYPGRLYQYHIVKAKAGSTTSSNQKSAQSPTRPAAEGSDAPPDTNDPPANSANDGEEATPAAPADAAAPGAPVAPATEEVEIEDEDIEEAKTITVFFYNNFPARGFIDYPYDVFRLIRFAYERGKVAVVMEDDHEFEKFVLLVQLLLETVYNVNKPQLTIQQAIALVTQYNDHSWSNDSLILSALAGLLCWGYSCEVININDEWPGQYKGMEDYANSFPAMTYFDPYIILEMGLQETCAGEAPPGFEREKLNEPPDEVIMPTSYYHAVKDVSSLNVFEEIMNKRRFAELVEQINNEKLNGLENVQGEDDKNVTVVTSTVKDDVSTVTKNTEAATTVRL